MKSKRGFNAAELVTVILLVVGILIAVIVPLMEGRAAKAMWAGANVSARTIQRAVSDHAAETSVAAVQTLVGKNLNDPGVQKALDFTAADLEGIYFAISDYTIASVNSTGLAAITVIASKTDAPSGSYRLETDGDWVRQ